MNDIYHYTVVSMQMTGSTTLEVLLHADHPHKVMAFEPGQYAAISFLRHRRPTPTRCFSITSAPTTQTAIQFGIQVKGMYTEAAQQSLKPGSKVIVEGPFGNCVFNSDRDRIAVLIAGGIGITPFMSMMRYVSRLALPNDMVLFYSNHSQEDIPFLREIAELAQHNPKLHPYFLISDGPTNLLAGQTVIKGHLDASQITAVLGKTFAESSYFVCGSPRFMSSISKQLVKAGVPASRVMSEDFSQGQAGPRSTRYSIPIQIYAATGIGIVLGSLALMLRDSALASSGYTPAGKVVGVSTASTATPTNTRQQTVINTITNLKTSTQSPSSSPTSITTPSTSGATGTRATSSTGTKTSPSNSPAPSTSTAPTVAPAVAPVLSFGASSTQITQGSSVTLSWSINANATTPIVCTASGGWSGSPKSSGSQSVSPSSTTTYTLVCDNNAGTSTQSVTVNVAPSCVSTPSNPC